MTWLFLSFKRSAAALKDLRALVTVSLLIAIAIAVGSLTVPVTQTIKISFVFLATSAVGMIGGPVYGLLSGAIIDVIGFMMKPTGGYNPAFTLITAFTGMLYGLFLYGIDIPHVASADEGTARGALQDIRALYASRAGRLTLARILLAKLSVTVIGNLVLNTWALYYMYGKPEFWPWFAPRLVKNATMFPIEVVMLFLVLVPVKRLYDMTRRQHA